MQRELRSVMQGGHYRRALSLRKASAGVWGQGSPETLNERQLTEVVEYTSVVLDRRSF